MSTAASFSDATQFVRPQTDSTTTDPVRTALPGVIRSISNSAVLPPEVLERDENQPRKHFDETALAELAESLKKHGQINPILVRRKPGEEGKYIIVAGERRWRAAQLAGLAAMNTLILQRELNSFEMLNLQYAENHDREDINPIEKGLLFQQMMQSKEYSARQLGRELGIDGNTVSHHVKLLDLPESIQEHVRSGTIGYVAAYQLTKIADSEAQQQAVEELLSGELNATALRQGAKESGSSGSKKTSQARKSKRFRIRGVDISLSSSKRVPYTEWVQALTEAIEKLQTDGRVRSKAA